jgi:copper(I)-binding protein
MRMLFGCAVTVALAATLSACGSDDSNELQASDAWVRFSGSSAAAYVTLSNESEVADALIGANVPPDVAKNVEIHQTTTSEGDMMGMQLNPAVDLPADFELVMKPGGYHLMLTDLPGMLPAVGSDIPLTLKFRSHEPITLDAEVRR